MADMWVKRNDILPPVTATLTDVQGDPVDLTDAQSVFFIMRHMRPPYEPVINAEAQIVGADPNEGKVSYQWQAEDTATAGGYWCEWEVQFPDGKATFPNDGYNTIAIVEDLDEGGS